MVYAQYKIQKPESALEDEMHKILGDFEILRTTPSINQQKEKMFSEEIYRLNRSYIKKQNQEYRQLSEYWQTAERAMEHEFYVMFFLNQNLSGNKSDQICSKSWPEFHILLYVN